MDSDLEPDVRNEASNEIRHQYLSAEQGRKMLDWSPLFNLEPACERLSPGTRSSSPHG